MSLWLSWHESTAIASTTAQKQTAGYSCQCCRLSHHSIAVAVLLRNNSCFQCCHLLTAITAGWLSLNRMFASPSCHFILSSHATHYSCCLPPPPLHCCYCCPAATAATLLLLLLCPAVAQSIHLCNFHQCCRCKLVVCICRRRHRCFPCCWYMLRPPYSSCAASIAAKQVCCLHFICCVIRWNSWLSLFLLIHCCRCFFFIVVIIVRWASCTKFITTIAAALKRSLIACCTATVELFSTLATNTSRHYCQCPIVATGWFFCLHLCHHCCTRWNCYEEK